MKKLYILFTFIILLSSCNKSDAPITVHSWEEYEETKLQYPERELIVNDTVCPSEIKRAKKDILKNHLVYYCRDYPEGVVIELNTIVNKYNITAEQRLNSCIPPPKGFSEHCYENLMRKEIEKRYGEKWIDSLERIALKNYIIKYPNEPYDENGIDLRTIYLKN